MRLLPSPGGSRTSGVGDAELEPAGPARQSKTIEAQRNGHKFRCHEQHNPLDATASTFMLSSWVFRIWILMVISLPVPVTAAPLRTHVWSGVHVGDACNPGPISCLSLQWTLPFLQPCTLQHGDVVRPVQVMNGFIEGMSMWLWLHRPCLFVVVLIFRCAAMACLCCGPSGAAPADNTHQGTRASTVADRQRRQTQKKCVVACPCCTLPTKKEVPSRPEVFLAQIATRCFPH